MLPNLLAQFDKNHPPPTMWSAFVVIDGTRVLMSTCDLKVMLEMRELYPEGNLIATTGVQNNA